MGGDCVIGDLPDGDQDFSLWTVSDADAERRWNLRLDGVEGALTALRLLPVTSEPGVTPMAVGPVMSELFAGPTDREPVALQGIMLSPGRYLVGVSRSAWDITATPGPTDYEFRLEPGALNPPNGDHEPNDDPAMAGAVEGSFDLSGTAGLSADYYAWDVTEPLDGEWWTLSAHTPLGQHLVMTLSDQAGAQLTSAEAYLTGEAVLRDLRLSPGTYLIRVELIAAQPTTKYLLGATSAEAGEADPEPNDTVATAIDIEPGTVMTGHVERTGALDTFRLDVDEARASTLIDAKLLWFEGPSRELCLIRVDDAGASESLKCLRGEEAVILQNLALEVGAYALTVRGDPQPGSPYYLRVDATRPIEPGFETEPNDTPSASTLVQAATGLRGRLGDGDEDYVRVRVEDGPQLWRAELAGASLTQFDLVRFDGITLARGHVDAGGTRAELPELYLPPGEHMFHVRGSGGEYSLELAPLGPPDPSAEREPNDDAASAERLAVGVERVGRLSTSADVDAFRFSLSGTEHVVVRIEPPDEGAINLSLEEAGMRLASVRGLPVGEPFIYDALLGPGDYQLVLSGSSGSGDGRYAVIVERADPFTLPDDIEPNDDLWMARPAPASGTIVGSGDVSGRADWFRLEPSADGEPLTVRVEGDVTGLAVADASPLAGPTELPLSSGAEDESVWRSDRLPVGVPLAMRVTADGPYRLTVGGGEPPPPLPELPVALTLTLPDAPPSGYWPEAQRLDGSLAITSETTSAMDIGLDAATSDRGWEIELERDSIEVPPGATETIPLQVVIGPDARAGVPTRLTLRVRDPDGSQRTTFAEIVPDALAPPVGEHQGWPLPEALRGGLDVAERSLGAAVLPSLDPAGEDALHDGVALSGGGLDRPGVVLPITLIVDLAGDEPVPVAGTILDPLAGDGFPAGMVRDFDLLLSVDGSTYETVLAGVLAAWPHEQAFVLPQPFQARFAQLRIRSVHGPSPDRVKLGEWKVVAQPGSVPQGLDLEIGDPDRGGHIVLLEPAAESPRADHYQWLQGLLTPDPGWHQLDAKAGAEVSWVLRFRDGRAARIGQVGWVDAPQADARFQAQRVSLSGSLGSPFGPWEPIGEWALERAADGSVAPFILPTPTWARFLRFQTGPVGSEGAIELPTAIPILEVLGPDAPWSVLGQWGAGNTAGPYEMTHRSEVPEGTSDANAADTPDDPAAAHPLAADDVARGDVHRGRDIDWYEVSIPEGRNSVAFTLSGDGGVAVALRLIDTAGEDIPLRFGPGDRPATVRYAANVTPGASYRVEVRQPAASVVVTFDESLSLAPWIPFVSQALRTYASGIEPGQEAIQLVPFEQDPLLEEWTDDPWLVRAAIDQRFAYSGTSGAEVGLTDATLLLAGRDGSRAILVITDGETTAGQEAPELWQAIGSVRPSIHAVHVGGAGEPLLSPRLIKDWAMAGSGSAQYARSQDDIDRAFERLAARLRRPASYRLSYETSEQELPPLEPGRLVVATPADPSGQAVPAPAGPGVAIELVLDTSGSMRVRFGGRRRIDVAKGVLTRLVDETLPPGTPVALRAFRQARRSCDSELTVPLGPLDPVAMREHIDGLTARASVRTPLAEAIAAVASDLAGVEGRRIVVVVSDGRESCGGDPAASVRSLVEQGFDVTVNVVGLGLDRATRRQIARLATLGNGTYFDARDPAELEAALRAAVSAPFHVTDTSGATVASGTVNGGAIELPPGTYRVLVLTEPPQAFEGVVVEEGGSISLEVGT